MINPSDDTRELVENRFNVLLNHPVRVNRKWFCKVIKNLECSLYPKGILASINLLIDIIKFKDFDEKPLQHSPKPLSVLLARNEHSVITQVRCVCLESLMSKWYIIVSRFAVLIRTNPSSCQKCIVSFLELWRIIVSVKTNLSVFDTKLFHCCLDIYVSLLSNNTPPIISLCLLDLFNEMLCYGNTLALQQDLAAEPRELAHMILRSVEHKNLLHIAPYIDENKIFLKKLILLVLKAIAITVREIIYDAFSDSESEEESDMSLIYYKTRNVIKIIDNFMKESEHYNAAMKPAEWIVCLFAEDDDYLIESMLCCLDIARMSCYRFDSILEMRDDLNPSITFLHFLNVIFFNVDLLVDFLKSNRTCFLLYFLNFLKYARSHWNEFTYTCRLQFNNINNLFINLRQVLENQVSNNEFSYDVDPILTLLLDCCERSRMT